MNTSAERVLAAIVHEGECWVFQGYRGSDGYGRLQEANRPVLAHRVMYAHAVGPVPDGYHLHHTCENPPCVNPAHLKPLTPREHRDAHRSATCLAGHLYSEHGYVWKKDGTRRCTRCSKDRAKERRRAYRALNPKRNAKREQTHCIRGHVFDEENTYRQADGRRRCRACAREYMRTRERKAS